MFENISQLIIINKAEDFSHSPPNKYIYIYFFLGKRSKKINYSSLPFPVLVTKLPPSVSGNISCYDQMTYKLQIHLVKLICYQLWPLWQAENTFVFRCCTTVSKAVKCCLLYCSFVLFFCTSIVPLYKKKKATIRTSEYRLTACLLSPQIIYNEGALLPYQST